MSRISRNLEQHTTLTPYPGGDYLDRYNYLTDEGDKYVAPVDSSPIGSVLEEMDKLDKLAYELTTPYEMRADKQRRPGEIRAILDRLRRAIAHDRHKQAATLQAVLNKMSK